jgi:hypothetical protein
MIGTIAADSPASFTSHGLSVLGNDALEIQLRGVLEHFLPVTDQMFGINDRKPDVVFSEEVGEHLLALDLRDFAEIPVSQHEVEGVEHQALLSARGKLGLQLGEIGPPLVDFPPLLVQVDCEPLAVEFVFTESLRPNRHFGFQGGELGLNESGHLRFFGRYPTSTHTIGHHIPNAN